MRREGWERVENEEKSRDSSVENEKSHPPGTWRHQRSVQQLAFFFHELFHGFAESAEKVAFTGRLHFVRRSLSNYFTRKISFNWNYSLQKRRQFFAKCYYNAIA